MSLCNVIIAALRTKCAADLDELLEFKVKQYVQGSVTHNSKRCMIQLYVLMQMYKQWR